MTPSVAGDEKIYCPYCQTFSRFDFSFYSRTYYHCPSCDLIFVKRKEDIKTVIDYYQNLYFDDYTEDQMSGHRTNIYRHILDVLEDYKNPGSLLDLGCGCGFFLKEAEERGWQVSGVDPSQKSIAYAKSLIGDAVVCGTLDDVPTDRRFDAITLINVLDHMVDACRQLQKVQNLLAPEGIIYLRFPNGLFHRSIIRMQTIITDKPILNRLLVFHEYAFTPSFIRKILKEQGFENIMLYNARISGAALYQHSPILKFLGGGLNGLLWPIVSFLKYVSCNRCLLGPSLEVTAMK